MLLITAFKVAISSITLSQPVCVCVCVCVCARARARSLVFVTMSEPKAVAVELERRLEGATALGLDNSLQKWIHLESQRREPAPPEKKAKPPGATVRWGETMGMSSMQPGISPIRVSILRALTHLQVTF